MNVPATRVFAPLARHQTREMKKSRIESRFAPRAAPHSLVANVIHPSPLFVAKRPSKLKEEEMGGRPKIVDSEIFTAFLIKRKGEREPLSSIP